MDDDFCHWWLIDAAHKTAIDVEELSLTAARLLDMYERSGDRRLDVLRLATSYELAREGYRVHELGQ